MTTKRKTNLHTILARCGYDFPSVELEGGDGVVVFDGFEDAARAQVPNLQIRLISGEEQI